MTRVLSGAILIVLVAAVVWLAPIGVLYAVVAVVLALAIGEYRALTPRLDVLRSVLGAALYLVIPLGALAAVRTLENGKQALSLLMLTVAVSDTAQYYTGRLFGRRPLAPVISPKKTIEGAIGGLVFGSLTLGVAGMWWLPRVDLSLRVLIGLAVVVLGIAGDLFESALKRAAGVKDSSTLIPGHGGILDRIDALLFAAPVYYVVLKYV